MRWLAAIVALIGCDAVFRIDAIKQDGPNPEGPLPFDAFECTPIGAGFLRVCAGGPDLPLAGAVSSDSNCPPMSVGVSSFCLFTGDNLELDNVSAIGSLPIVFAARHTLTVMGTLDASSTASVKGAGARTCPTGTAQALSAGAGGGAGGSWHTSGGGGGSDASDSHAFPSTPEAAQPVLVGGGWHRWRDRWRRRSRRRWHLPGRG